MDDVIIFQQVKRVFNEVKAMSKSDLYDALKSGHTNPKMLALHFTAIQEKGLVYLDDIYNLEVSTPLTVIIHAIYPGLCLSKKKLDALNAERFLVAEHWSTESGTAAYACENALKNQLHTHNVLLIRTTQHKGTWREKTDRRTIRQYVLQHLQDMFSKAVDRGCVTYSTQQQAKGFCCNGKPDVTGELQENVPAVHPTFNLSLFLKTGTSAITNCFNYVLRRRVHGKGQFKRLAVMSVNRQNVIRERVGFPDRVKLDFFKPIETKRKRGSDEWLSKENLREGSEGAVQSKKTRPTPDLGTPESEVHQKQSKVE
eukprot:TCONS_00061662-protein